MKDKSNRLSRLKRSLLRFQLFTPVKRNGFIFLIITAITIYVIENQFYGEESFYNPYLELFGWLFGVFALLIIGLGFLYTLICWIHLLVNFSKIEADISIGLEDGKKGEVGKVAVRLSLSKVLMPLVGYIKMRIIFENGDYSQPIILNSFTSGWKDLLPKEGNADLWLTERRQYNVKGFLISFEDYLQFFSLSAFKKTKKLFYLYPPKTDIDTEDIRPSKADEMVEKVKTSKKIEGDYLNYKDFESGDDVRRIVWKIFAKNKELVVRIPEVINPYASHVNFFGSFYNTLSTDYGSGYAKGMLDYYKDIIYNICLSLQKTDRKVKFNIDQAVSDTINVEKQDEMKYKLSGARWQNEMAATDLQVPANEVVLCVSSLMPVEELEELINKRPVNLFVVKTSRYLDNQHLFNWKNLFLRMEGKNELSKLRWLMSSSRRTIRKNEKKINELIANSDFQGQVI
ncbi:MAG TPA: hypothetical protein PKL31_04220 [Fulvivirga sp.]|nr:hypothetical protein [Fulvivirga sp.]